MNELPTSVVIKELSNITNIKQAQDYIKKNYDDTTMTFRDFITNYMANHPEIKESSLIANSGLPRNYAYEIINGNKKATRDRIIAICYASGMSFEDANRALTYSQNSILYAKDQRDACIIINFNIKKPADDHCRSVMELNEYLISQELEPLKLSRNV